MALRECRQAGAFPFFCFLAVDGAGVSGSSGMGGPRRCNVQVCEFVAMYVDISSIHGVWRHPALEEREREEILLGDEREGQCGA